MQEMNWQPITGCSPISAGCANCLGMKVAGRDDGVTVRGLTVQRGSGPVWNGRLRFNKGWLRRPIELRVPRHIHVCANGDAFHEAVEPAWLNSIFDVIDQAPHHTMQLLTKRSRRMRDYITARYPFGAPPHLHLGVSAERQAEADQRIEDLMSTPAAVRYVTFYPLLGPIDATRFLASGSIRYGLAGAEPERPAEESWFSDLERTHAACGVPFKRFQDLVGGVH